MMDLGWDHLVTVMLTVFLVVLCVMVHYEGMRIFSNWLDRSHLRPRPRIAMLIFGQLGLHVVAIWIFAAGYFSLLQDPAFGAIHSATAMHFLDYVYFSAVTYSTLGLGDLIPTGNVRFLTGMESVMGMVLITWSASFTFIEMRRFWRPEQ